MPKDVGINCDEEDSSTRYYYNKQSKTCLPFNYGGCGGNENNFENVYDCHEACGGGEPLLIVLMVVVAGCYLTFFEILVQRVDLPNLSNLPNIPVRLKMKL